MGLKMYFNSGNKKLDLHSKTLRSGDHPEKVRDGNLDDSNNPDDVLLKDYLLQTVLRFYTTSLRMLRHKCKRFIAKQKKLKSARLNPNSTLWI